MIKTLFTYTLGLISLILAITQTCKDFPNFDYKSNPVQPFDFKHAELRITLEPELNLVRGVVTYSVTSKIDGETRFVLQTEESAIDAIIIDEAKGDFFVSNDSLIIQLPDSSKAGSSFNISITWQATSRFGLYKDSESNFWSSKNPKAHRHWIPGFDHPRNELTFDAYFTIPYENEVLFNGELVGSATKPSNKKELHYRSDTEVPFTGLGFVLGDFLISEVTSGLTTVRLFSSNQKYNEEERLALIREASVLKKDIEKTLSMEYPWEGLNIVVLPDNYWEERTHGSGTIFLFENLGSLSNQLKRGMYAQWFGEYHRGEQFFDFESAGDELMRTALHFSLSDEQALIENPDSVNTIYSWNQWQQSFKAKPIIFQETVSNSLSEMLRNFDGIVEFEDYAEVWYQQTGLPWFDISFDETQETETNEDESLKYVISADYDETNFGLKLIFELEKGNGDILHSLSMTEHSFDDSVNHEVNFTGSKDTVFFSLSPSVEYVSFSEGTASLNEITFGDFPLFFLLNQLRSNNAKDRAIAARLLVSYSDNPDLQLALNDVMDVEQNPMVKAALFGTMAAITNGATGTEQQFLNGLNSSDIEIQLASITALSNYPDNEMVMNSIRSKVLRTNVTSIFERALNTYSELVIADEIVSLAQRLQRVDSSGSKTLYLINEYSETDSNEVFITIAEEYIGTSYPYSTRKEALTFLLGADEDTDRWITRINMLLKDRDPRIRYQSLKGVTLLRPSDALKILGSVEQNEFDIRVLLEVDNLLEQISR
tara:strand:+ start:19515 stop:21824 length:2310 start_codon:yes stop_codon:yes gene_type:complete